MKIRPFGAQLFHADGEMGGHDDAKTRFSPLCEGAQKRVKGQM